jgi:hypothetical protein
MDEFGSFNTTFGITKPSKVDGARFEFQQEINSNLAEQP